MALPKESAGAAERRAALMQDWLTSADVAAMLSGNVRFVAKLRKQGRLLGVWVSVEKGYRHPACQFSQNTLLPVMHALLQVLPPGNGSGWSQAEWLYSPHALLNKREPSELLAAEPEQVLAAAKQEYGEDSDVRW